MVVVYGRFLDGGMRGGVCKGEEEGAGEWLGGGECWC